MDASKCPQLKKSVKACFKACLAHDEYANMETSIDFLQAHLRTPNFWPFSGKSRASLNMCPSCFSLAELPMYNTPMQWSDVRQKYRQDYSQKAYRSHSKHPTANHSLSELVQQAAQNLVNSKSNTQDQRGLLNARSEHAGEPQKKKKINPGAKKGNPIIHFRTIHISFYQFL